MLTNTLLKILLSCCFLRTLLKYLPAPLDRRPGQSIGDNISDCRLHRHSTTRSESAWDYIEGGPDGRWCSGHVGQRGPFRLQTPVRPHLRRSTDCLPESASTPLVAPLPLGICPSR